jgi:hypothetical protein
MMCSRAIRWTRQLPRKTALAGLRREKIRRSALVACGLSLEDSWARRQIDRRARDVTPALAACLDNPVKPEAITTHARYHPPVSRRAGAVGQSAAKSGLRFHLLALRPPRPTRKSEVAATMGEPLIEEARQGGDGFGCVQNPASPAGEGTIGIRIRPAMEHRPAVGAQARCNVTS